MDSLGLVFLFQIFFSFILLWGILFNLFLKQKQVITLSILLLFIFLVEIFSTYRIGIILFITYSLIKTFLVYRNYQNFLVAALSSITSYTLLLGVCFFSLDVPRIIFDFEVNSGSIVFYFFMLLGGFSLTLICFAFRYFVKVTNLLTALASIEKKYILSSLAVLLIFYAISLFHHTFLYPTYLFSFIFSFILLFLCGAFSCIIIYWFMLSYKNSKELHHLLSSLEAIKTQYETTLEFQHDYKNIIHSISGYLNHNDLNAAKKYIEELTSYSSSILIPEFYHQLEKIKLLPVQSIFASFKEDMRISNIPFNLLVKNEITQLDVDTIDIVHCLSVLLTNAKEEVASQKSGEINATISFSKNITTFSIRNTLTTSVSLSEISEHGFTTKVGHHGKGLTIIKKIVGRYKNFDYVIRSEPGLYIASLEIRNTKL